jgi:hypothetical protein
MPENGNYRHQGDIVLESLVEVLFVVTISESYRYPFEPANSSLD